MPEENTNQTPNDKGTVTQDPTPGSGTDGPKAAATATAAPPASENEVDYKTKFSESSREAQRLLQENQRLQAILANTAAQQQHAARMQQQHMANQPESQEWDYGQIRDAILENDPNTLKNWEERVVDKAHRRIAAMQQAGAVRQQRISSSVASLTEAFKDPNSAIAHESLAQYQRLLYDPSYSFARIPGDDIDLPTPEGIIKINPHLMRIAVMETRAKFGAKTDAAVSRAHQDNAFIESAGGGNDKPQEKSKFNAQKHMTQKEREFCDKTKQPYEEWWKFSKPELKEARLKAGKPVSSKDL